MTETVRRHLERRWEATLHRPTVDVYQRLIKTDVFAAGSPMILDSGCGTGKSTLHLAGTYPGYLVIGVDRSNVRLAKSCVRDELNVQGNCVLVRAELATFWRLLVRDGHQLQRHFILYPNPWPKPGHLARRWHGHPVFPWLLALGGKIELRCNWETYALEFALAIQLATGREVSVGQYQPQEGISPFELKYAERGHALFSVHVHESVTAAFKLQW